MGATGGDGHHIAQPLRHGFTEHRITPGENGAIRAQRQTAKPARGNRHNITHPGRHRRGHHHAP